MGGLNILVNKAGVGAGGAEVAQFKTVRPTDFIGRLFCCRAFVKACRQVGGGGRIVTISSVAQHLPAPESAPYGMAKAGLGSLIRSLSRELAEGRKNVNNIAPGMVQTPITQGRLDDPEKRDQSMRVIPRHRPGQPDEIAPTGQTWTIDGGLPMQWAAHDPSA